MHVEMHVHPISLVHICMYVAGFREWHGFAAFELLAGDWLQSTAKVVTIEHSVSCRSLLFSRPWLQ